MALENRGVPTVVVCTSPFLDSAHTHARMLGHSGFQPLVIPHPLGGLAPEQVRDRATTLEEEIAEALTRGNLA